MAGETVAKSSEANGFKNVLAKKDIECIVEKSLGSKVNIVNYHLENYSSDTLGLMGAHLNLVLEVSRDGSKAKEAHTYFLKTFPYNTEYKAKFVENSGMFAKEMYFYNLIMPELMKSSEDKSWAPRCYLVKENLLVLENLKLKNYAVKGVFPNFPVSLLKVALSSLAKMHAASLLAEKRLGKTFVEMYPKELSGELLFSLEGPFREWYRSGIAITTRVAEKLGLNREIVPKVYNLLLKKILPSATRRNVMNHGDLWANNCMFNESSCVFVDFQLMRYVPAMFDVAQLIYFNVRKEVRDECEVELLKCYHESMCEALRSGGMVPPSFEDILDEYEEMRIAGIVSINLYFPVQQLEDAKKNEMLHDSEGFQDLFCRDRLSMCLENMEKDQRYREVVTSVVREFVDLSKTLFN